LKAIIKEMFNQNTFNFAALHKIINMIVRSLGRMQIWLGRRENVLDQLCNEFDDEDEETEQDV